MLFGSILLFLVLKSTYACSGKSDEESQECESEGFIGHETNCNRFYRCVPEGQGGYTKYLFECPEGLVWDQDIQTCSWPKSDTCGKELPEQPGQSSHSEQPGQPGQPDQPSQLEQPEHPGQPGQHGQPGQQGQSERSGQSGQPGQPGRSSADCSRKGFMGDENDSTIYYRLVYDGQNGFIKYKSHCGLGTVWSQRQCACLYPFQVETD